MCPEASCLTEQSTKVILHFAKKDSIKVDIATVFMVEAFEVLYKIEYLYYT